MRQKAPIYEGIKQLLKSRIESGEWGEGDRVPSEYELVEQLCVGRHRVRPALRELEIEGYLVRKRGSGSYVAPAANRMTAIKVAGKDTMAMFFPRYVGGYVRQVVDGFMQHMANSSRRTIVYNIETDRTSETKSLKTIVESGISGLVAWIDHDTPANRKYLASLTKKHFPVVLVDRYLEGLDVDHVVSANEDIGYRLTRALLESDHKRIAFVGYKEDVSSINDRFKGYERALQEAGLLDEGGHGAQSTNHRFQLDLDLVLFKAREAVGEVMSLHDRPTAFVCINDMFADKVHKQLVRLGFTIPGDTELATVDDNHPIGHDRPPMTRIVQQAYEVGAQSAELLLARLADPGVPVQRRYIQAGPILRERETRPVGRRQERREEEKSIHIFSEARAGE